MSGSGKSTISREIYDYLMEKRITCTVIPMDYFYKEGPQPSFDVPDAFDFKKLRDCIATLQNNRPYTIYQYDYEMNTYMKHKAYTLYNSKVILIEGLYANYCRFLLL
jgi:uridine kinase